VEVEIAQIKSLVMTLVQLWTIGQLSQKAFRNVCLGIKAIGTTWCFSREEAAAGLASLISNPITITRRANLGKCVFFNRNKPNA
jgi:hypothetical protein